MKSFFWETDIPEWYECVVLYSEVALKHQVVSLHFKVAADRTILDAEVEKKLTSKDGAIVKECKEMIAKNQRIPRRVQFSCGVEFIENDFSEFIMQMEVERMMAEDEPLSSEEFLMSSDTEEEFFDEGNFYEAEVFGDRFIGEPQERCLSTRTSSMKQHMLKSILNGTESPLLGKDKEYLCDIESSCSSVMSLGATNSGLSELGFWEIDMDQHTDDESEEEILAMDIEDDFNLEQVKADAWASSTVVGEHRRVSSEPLLSNTADQVVSSELERKAAFISTRGKEKEIWQTYRAEITNTWRAELKDLQRQLFAYE